MVPSELEDYLLIRFVLDYITCIDYMDWLNQPRERNSPRASGHILSKSRDGDTFEFGSIRTAKTRFSISKYTILKHQACRDSRVLPVSIVTPADFNGMSF
ncbi:hypothetical protein M758_4G046800 [Ceratodon purpureus]|nr:hypothetical protein M758_4G046800 [Ceratodon purpureus]